jgi:hypothetical protein
MQIKECTESAQTGRYYVPAVGMFEEQKRVV